MLVAVPKVTVPPTGKVLLAPSCRVPAWMVVPPEYVFPPLRLTVPPLTASATFCVPLPRVSLIVPANVDEPATVSVEIAAVLLLPTRLGWRAVAPAVTSRSPTVWLKPFRSRVPLLVGVPKASAPAVGNVLLAPSCRVPPWMSVPPL